ncbi:MAG: hypothetical protein GF344_05740 [Chitinivibrionales bacterium]|nr:hypothetical protein [Chitinivibrionales bacterium]MBD3356469.1 hypothetical protein [Chitinivibrionales bacterium]
MKLLPAILVFATYAAVSAAQSGTTSTYSSSDYGSVSVDNERRFGAFLAMGYGFPVGGRYIGSSEVYDLRDNWPHSPIDVEDHFLNYGRGIKVEGGVSYRFLERVRARLGFQFSGGTPKIGIVQDQRYNARVTERTYRWSMFGIKGLVVPRFEVFELLDMYTGVGMGIFFTSSSYNITQTGGLTAKAEADHSPTIGFLGLYGVDFPIADNIMVFGELNLEAVRVTTKTLRVYDSNFSDGDAYPNSTENYEDDVTDRDPRQRTPATNVALRLGVRFDIF